MLRICRKAAKQLDTVARHVILHVYVAVQKYAQIANLTLRA